MNTQEIEKKLRLRVQKHCFAGVFPSNLIPKNINAYAIVNLDPWPKKGTHWVVVGRGEYFDPLGFPPKVLKIRDFLLSFKNKSKIWINNVRVQDYFSNVCGHYCIFYIIMRCNNKLSPSGIVNKLRRMENSDKFVFDYINKIMI